jgi:plasmid replication initiation protein
MTTNHVVAKANELIDARYKLNVQAQKLLLCCIGKLDGRKEVPKESILTANEFAEMTGIPLNDAYKELYQAADKLFNASLKLIEDGEEVEIVWVQEKAKKLKGQGQVRLVWSDRVRRYLGELEGCFTKYKLKSVSTLKSAHSIRLYELLMLWQSTGIRTISVDDLKASLGLSDAYPQFFIFNRDVLKPSMKEINTRSDIKVRVETLKTGRKITALKFRFIETKQLKLEVEV